MSQLSFKIVNHPAQARHPLTNKPLVDDDGKTPVPLFPKEKALALEGEAGKFVLIAYISAVGNLSFIAPSLGEKVIEKAVEYVKSQLQVSGTNVIAPPAPPAGEDDEDEDD